jgi:hypothetical protein
VHPACDIKAYNYKEEKTGLSEEMKWDEIRGATERERYKKKDRKINKNACIVTASTHPHSPTRHVRPGIASWVY